VSDHPNQRPTGAKIPIIDPLARAETSSAFADAQTLRDLNVFPIEGEGMSLFQFFDRTRTSSGREALRRFLAQPKASLEEIEQTQLTLRYLADRSNRDRWDFRASDRGMGYLEGYLESYIRPLEGKRTPAYFIRALWYRTSYKKYYEHLDSCVRRTHRYLLGIAQLIEQVSNSSDAKIPGQLLAHLDRLRRLLEHPIAAELRKTGGKESRFSSWNVLYFDQFLRRELLPLLREALDACYEIDAWKSLGIVIEEKKFRFPALRQRGDADTSVRARGLYHPFLEHPVANDIEIGADRNFVFVTGPNMAGKTTFLKSIGVSVYLAHLGSAVPAEELSLPVFDAVCSSLSVLDNIEKGYSYYYTEVDRVKTVAQQLHDGRHLFVLFDELFKGTNIKDAFDGSCLVIQGFLHFPESRFLVSSHLVELKDRLDEEVASEPSDSESPIQYVYFESEVVDGIPRFSYHLRPGISQERLGLLILKNEGIERLLGVQT